MSSLPVKKPWTPARKKAFIIAVLRGGSRRYPPKYETLNEAKTEKKINATTGRIAQHFRCASCHNEFPAKQVEVDHITPIIGIHGFTTWDAFIEGLFCSKANLQVLCTPCHKAKTLREKKEKQR